MKLSYLLIPFIIISVSCAFTLPATNMLGNLSMYSHSVTGLANPSLGNDSASKWYVDNLLSGKLSLSGGVLTGVVTSTLPMTFKSTGAPTAPSANDIKFYASNGVPYYRNSSGSYIISGGTVTGGSGDVVGPGSSTSHNFASFASASGKTLEDSGKSSSSFADATTTTNALALKASSSSLWTKINKSGDTMSGPLAMGSQKVTGVLNGTAAQDGVAYAQLRVGRAFVSIGFANADYICDSTADDVQWQSANNYCYYSPDVKTVVVMPGHYQFTSVFKQWPGVQVVGVGNSKTGLGYTAFVPTLVGASRVDVSSQISAIELSKDDVLSGIQFYYPNQVTNATPTAYPYTIVFNQTDKNSDDITIENCVSVNAYDFIKTGPAGYNRATIKNVVGCAIHNGINTVGSYDVDRYTDVHFWPFCVAGNTVLTAWIWANGIAFSATNSADWAEYERCFGFGYHYGLFLNNTQCVHFMNGGFDACDYPIYLKGADYSVISASELVSTQFPSGTGGHYGVYISGGATNNTISNNDVRCNGLGVLFDGSSCENIVSANTISFGWRNDASVRGVSIGSGSDRNVIAENKINGYGSNAEGILLASQYNPITGNQFSRCHARVIYYVSENYNTLTGNVAYNCGAVTGSPGAQDVVAHNIGI